MGDYLIIISWILKLEVPILISWFHYKLLTHKIGPSNVRVFSSIVKTFQNRIRMEGFTQGYTQDYSSDRSNYYWSERLHHFSSLRYIFWDITQVNMRLLCNLLACGACKWTYHRCSDSSSFLLYASDMCGAIAPFSLRRWYVLVVPSAELVASQQLFVYITSTGAARCAHLLVLRTL